MFRHLEQELLKRGERVLDEVTAGIGLEALELVVGRVLHPVADLDRAGLEVAAHRPGPPALRPGLVPRVGGPQHRQRVAVGGLDVAGVHELVERHVVHGHVRSRLAEREVVEDDCLLVFRDLDVELDE